MKYLSWFDGVGMFSLAFERAGFECVGACEIDKFARRVRTARLGAPALYPEDILTVDPATIPRADVWIGGSPCQSFSVAGEREGLDGTSGLLLHWIALAKAAKPEWFLLENVPGMLTGRDEEDDKDRGLDAEDDVGGSAGGSVSWFASVLGALADAGFRDCEWGVLDGQWFGVAQRRRRVFLIAHHESFGGAGAFRPGSFFSEPEGVPRNPASRGETRAGAAGRPADGAGARRVASALTASDGHHGRRSPRGDGSDNIVASALQGGGRRGHRVDAEGDPGGHVVLAFNWQSGGSAAMLGVGDRVTALQTSQTPAVFGIPERERALTTSCTRLDADTETLLPVDDGPRRLTPLECELLQGLPPGWTCLCGDSRTAHCKCPDGPRYRAIGNGGVVPCVEWIARRLRDTATLDIALGVV